MSKLTDKITGKVSKSKIVDPRDSDPGYAEATRIYDLALDEHEDWWSEFDPADSDPADFADELFDKICDAYEVEPDSDTGRELYDHVYAGLT